jgi:AcrR family transcriptional regulator
MCGMSPRTDPTVDASAPSEVPAADVPAADVPAADVPAADVPAADVREADVRAEPARGPIWGRPETRRRSTLSRATIVKAAIELADREGLGAVSIRRVAAELGARAMSIYTYLDSKDELFQLMADDAAGAILLPDPFPADWREGLSLIARRSRDVFMRHPWVVELPAEGRMRGGPNALRHVEQSLRAVAGLGLPPHRQWLILMAVDDYTLGYVTREVLQQAVHEGWDQQRTMILDQPYYRQQLASGEFPLLKALLDQEQPEVDAFEIGLRWLLDGIEADLPKP